MISCGGKPDTNCNHIMDGGHLARVTARGNRGGCIRNHWPAGAGAPYRMLYPDTAIPVTVYVLIARTPALPACRIS